ncbi:MAG: 16S rRNA (guanine(527)-N(7))-methyltransferase RsmG [Acidobacteria bacterium]|nr:MAG: 16S rRNA (guanine(527)-N(7))-methyltransferase RsmG [Acidobacteriota bacterium]REK03970.1 MAG: 16S rRNA (guanine(527)-N(7))-methyltransferase RsmG [Acidobacteriota bacterium]REK15132.1 MAG: 16S rRNA (guanine(527)-N(7))-methyltransferase RsmG [Acidobacteriota bacterium]REK46222.1 MAG: 16S rRNA (guanine(527)-N(7))-methyltransferase RsmG [Acidobacteriota bacterium]
MTDEFLSAVEANREEFGIELSPDHSRQLADYYEFLVSKNERLHLVAPCSPEEFAVRHVLESLFVTDRISPRRMVVDVGSGGGLPGLPIAIVRKDLTTILIESKEKKSTFLEAAVTKLGIGERVKVVNKQFAESYARQDAIIVSRALDKFTNVLPRLLKWAAGRRCILFGGPSLEEALAESKVSFERDLIPMSERRFVFDIGPTRKRVG